VPHLDLISYDTASVAETEQVGAALAATLVGGECVALDGDLGAGKTQFVRGLVAGLGGDRRQVSSPTYVLLHVYEIGTRREGRTPDAAAAGAAAAAMRLVVYHLDAYRASGSDELEAIGFTELLDQGGVVVVEWAARIADLLPPDRIDVRIEAVGESARRITVRRPGPRAGTSEEA
jgi:tRNA threonylcarbamoyladenosine biosynthesis protein TsaE